MSHAATHWLATVPPSDMTHGEFRVLFHLCDCHNPSAGCFPKQAYLREHTGLSNGGLNKALGELERKGLIRRDQDRDEQTNRQKPTRYVLGFELEKQKKPSPLSGAGAVSTFDAVPSPLSEGSVSTGVESYTKEEPVREPVKEPCASEAEPQTGLIDDGFLDRFLAAHPRPGSRGLTAEALDDALASGADPDDLVAAAKAYAVEQKGNAPRYIAYSENWLKAGRWSSYQPKPPTATVDAVNEGWVQAFKSRNGTVARRCPMRTVVELLAADRITATDCAAVGVKL